MLKDIIKCKFLAGKEDLILDWLKNNWNPIDLAGRIIKNTTSNMI